MIVFSTIEDWISTNKEWVFSGIGVIAITVVGAFFSRVVKLIASRRALPPPAASIKPPSERRRHPNFGELDEMSVIGESRYRSALQCDFCLKSQTSVGQLLTMSGSRICTSCIGAATSLLDRQKNIAELVRNIADLTFAIQDPTIDPSLKRVYEGRIHDFSQNARKRNREAAGDLVAGAKLIRPIGAGAFATVWLAETTREVIMKGERTVAVKIFDQDKLAQGLMLWRFQRGIRAMRMLSELGSQKPPSIVRFIEIDRDLLSFSMEYLPGGDIHDLPNRHLSQDARMKIFLQVASAVAFSHKNGIIHRDIKPANVVLRRVDDAALTDFDIADISFASTRSIYASSLGTPLFAAPEQLADSRIAAHPTADIYSLGKLLIFLLTQRPPPLGSTERNTSPPTYIAKLGTPTFSQAIALAIRDNPTERPQSVGDLLNELHLKAS